MIKHLFIKKVVAVSMLIVFAFSITPTIVFHNWLADHSDTTKRSSHVTGEQIGKITFNCHCDNIVAESPFTEPGKIIAEPAIRFFIFTEASTTTRYISSPHIFYSLRGPPAL